LIILQPLAILIGAALVLIPGEIRWRAVRTPLLLLTALAVVMGAQLVPLPPAVWQALPGREQLGSYIGAAGLDAVWRPLSLTPDLTLASLIGLGVPAAGLIAFASLPEQRTHQLLSFLIIAVALSALLGLSQLAGGPNSIFYTYSITNSGSAVGLFANRNHQALLVAMAFPMLAILALSRQHDPQRQRVLRWIYAAIAIALIPFIIVIGSRAGIILGIIGLAFAIWIIKSSGQITRDNNAAMHRLIRKVILPATSAAAAGVVLATVFLSRDEALRRLYAMDISDDVRLEYLPILLRISLNFLPFGSGFGSFDPVFRYYEPDALLQPRYLNHAHNDWVELVMTGGVPAAAIALVFGMWALHRFIALRAWRPTNSRARFACLGFAMIVLGLIASVVDYPLRTPVHALLLAFAAAWLAASGQNERGRMSA
jgi:hypothetical protein